MKILVVDDCQTTRKLLGIYLKTKGYDVAFAVNGLEAIEKLSTDNINLVLSDLNMPYMDGIELVSAIKSSPDIAHIPVIMITTVADPEDRQKAFAAGASGYLVKPVSAEDISLNIRHIIKNIFENEGGAVND